MPRNASGAGEATGFLQSLKDYVGFDEQSTAALRAFHPIAKPCFGALVEDFYAQIEAHPGARLAMKDAGGRVGHLKGTLSHWLDTLLAGPHDDSYLAMRQRVGRVHVLLDLPQAYLLAAMNRLRTSLLEVLRDAAPAMEPARAKSIGEAVNEIIDIDLAILLETYRDDLVTRNRAAERLATVGQLAGNLGDELQAPLISMASSLTMLRNELEPAAAQDPKVRKHLARIDLEIARSTQTVRDLQDLSRDQPPRRRPTDLRFLCEASIDAANLPSTVEVKIVIPDGLTIDADPDQLERVIANLLVNSAQAMQGKDTGGHIWLHGERHDAVASLRVRDDGPGVPPDARPRLFEPLFTTKAKGTGLGLALGRRIVEAHGGSLVLEPTQTGAAFLIAIPDAGDGDQVAGWATPDSSSDG